MVPRASDVDTQRNLCGCHRQVQVMACLAGLRNDLACLLFVDYLSEVAGGLGAADELNPDSRTAGSDLQGEAMGSRSFPGAGALLVAAPCFLGAVCELRTSSQGNVFTQPRLLKVG